VAEGQRAGARRWVVTESTTESPGLCCVLNGFEATGRQEARALTPTKSMGVMMELKLVRWRVAHVMPPPSSGPTVVTPCRGGEVVKGEDTPVQMILLRDGSHQTTAQLATSISAMLRKGSREARLSREERSSRGPYHVSQLSLI
jgi:hypothetical protein